MKPKYLILVAGITAALSCSALAQQDEKLGKLSFPTSCDPKVQAEFERGVAMIHSYWFIYARRTFEEVLQQDPSCAIAYLGIALDYLGNTLATTPTRAEAEAGWAALEKAHAIGAKTQRDLGQLQTHADPIGGNMVKIVQVNSAYRNGMQCLETSWCVLHRDSIVFRMIRQRHEPNKTVRFVL